MLFDRIERSLDRLAPGATPAVAVSGGADSVFLLHALHALQRVSAVLHVNHKLRGAASDDDEAFVRQLASSLHLPVFVATAPIAAGNVEQEARRARYRFFLEHLAAHRDSAYVATAHTLDDQAETVLDRFLRGSRSPGLAAIRPSRGPVIRPLLDIRHEEIRAWLKSSNLEWREDLSNLDPAFRRNRIRQQHLPALTRDLNPRLAETLAATAVHAQDEEAYWSAEISRLAPECVIPAANAVLIERQKVYPLATAVQRRLLRHAVELARGSLRSIDFSHIERIRSLLSAGAGHRRVQIPGLDVVRSFGWLRLSHSLPPLSNFQTTLVVPGTTALVYPPITVVVEQSAVSAVYTDVGVGLPERDRLKPALVAEPLVLRNWRPGDRYCSSLTAEPEKIKALFQKFRVPLWERRAWPVVTAGDEKGPIVWARGFGVAREFAAEPHEKGFAISEPENQSESILWRRTSDLNRETL